MMTLWFLGIFQALGGAWPASKPHNLLLGVQWSQASRSFDSQGLKTPASVSRTNLSLEYGYRLKPAHLVGAFAQSAAVTTTVPRMGLFWQFHPSLETPLATRVWLGYENESLFFYGQLLLGQSGSLGAWSFFGELRPGITLWTDRPVTLQAEVTVGAVYKGRHMVALFGWPQWHLQSSLPNKAYERFYADINYFYQWRPDFWVGIGYHEILQGRQHPAFKGWQLGVIWNF